MEIKKIINKIVPQTKICNFNFFLLVPIESVEELMSRTVGSCIYVYQKDGKNYKKGDRCRVTPANGKDFCSTHKKCSREENEFIKEKEKNLGKRKSNQGQHSHHPKKHQKADESSFVSRVMGTLNPRKVSEVQDNLIASRELDDNNRDISFHFPKDKDSVYCRDRILRIIERNRPETEENQYDSDGFAEDEGYSSDSENDEDRPFSANPIETGLFQETLISLTEQGMFKGAELVEYFTETPGYRASLEFDPTFRRAQRAWLESMIDVRTEISPGWVVLGLATMNFAMLQTKQMMIEDDDKVKKPTKS